MQPPRTFAQIIKYLFVSTALSGPIAVAHQPSFPVIGLVPVAN